MSKRKVTPWFIGKKKPARPGVYQRDYRGTPVIACDAFCRWDGSKWFSYSWDVRVAAMEMRESMFQHEPRWRGLTKPKK